MKKINKLAGYRVSLGKSRKEIAQLLNISTTAYRNKEIGVTSIKDHEKIILVKFFKDNGINTSIEDLFF